MLLKDLKSEREKELEKLSGSRLAIKLKKISYLAAYGMPLRDFIKYIFLFPFKPVLGKINSLILRKSGVAYSAAGGDKLLISVYIGNAGIGDAIVALAAVRSMSVLAGGNAVIDIFFRSPDSIRFMASGLPFVGKVLPLYEFPGLKKFYDVNIKLNTYFMGEKVNPSGKEKIPLFFPEFGKMLDSVKKNREEILKYIKTRPFSEGALSDIVAEKGLSRETYLSYSMGLAAEGRHVPTEEYSESLGKTQAILKKFGLDYKKFVTVHDGWDENTRIKSGKPTKSYPIKKWEILAGKFKTAFPGYSLVQLGGSGNGGNIAAADVNLRGKTSLEEAWMILSAAALHVDTDSGLVHMASAAGTKCAVLFGPTNIGYCSYKNNINIPPSFCGNCWWAADGWMDKCPLGFSSARCMESIEPSAVIEKIRQFLHA